MNSAEKVMKRRTSPVSFAIIMAERMSPQIDNPSSHGASDWSMIASSPIEMVLYCRKDINWAGICPLVNKNGEK